jgi:hypothetical protein
MPKQCKANKQKHEQPTPQKDPAAQPGRGRRGDAIQDAGVRQEMRLQASPCFVCFSFCVSFCSMRAFLLVSSPQTFTRVCLCLVASFVLCLFVASLFLSCFVFMSCSFSFCLLLFCICFVCRVLLSNAARAARSSRPRFVLRRSTLARF